MDEDIKEFAKEIAVKLYQKMARAGLYTGDDYSESVRQSIEHKMKKENWVKFVTEKDSL